MKMLKDICYKVNVVSTSGDMNTWVQGIAFDAQEVKEGYMFIAIEGLRDDGHDFIPRAIKNGATSILVEKMPEPLSPKVTYVQAKDSAQALGIIAANYYDNPSEKIKLIGITGTNGKTTVATLSYNFFTSLGYKTGLFSTICNKIDGEIIPSFHTTPDSITINKLLADMVKLGCSHCFMEVSSHAIVQRRIAGLHFSGGVFTNISHDHLDYHKTFQKYVLAKKYFFDTLPSEAFALINMDDRRGGVMVQNTKAVTKTFSLKKMADFRAKLISSTFEGIELEIDNRQIWCRLVGDFNAYNFLSSYAIAVLLKENPEHSLNLLSAVPGVPGRFEIVTPGSKFTAIVDYSHTPGALENVLTTIAHFRIVNGRIITVVGCGGNRDTLKRPLMASIACRYSDVVIFTSDNPRDENPLEIINDMQRGVEKKDEKKTFSVADREEAIKMACMMAQEHDIILIAGKGHEKFQEIKGTKYPFNDRIILERMLKMFAR